MDQRRYIWALAYGAYAVVGELTNGVRAWSWSALEIYEQCPLKYAEEKLRGNKQPQSPAMARGNEVHKAGAAFIVGDDEVVFPKEYTKFDKLLWEIRDTPTDDKVVEQQWGFDINWRPTGWFGADVRLRNILDVGVVYPDGTGDVIDWKTGNIYDKNADQRELNAIAFLRRYPHVETVTSRMCYLDSGEERLEDFHAEDLTSLIAKWEKRVEPLFTDTLFAPRPNDKCQWCHLAKSKNGICKFG